MKKLYSLLMILAMVATFSACSKDEKVELPKSISSTAIKNQLMDGSAGGTTSNNIVFSRSDFKELKEFEKFVKSGKLQSSSLIEVKKVASDIKHKNVKLTIKDSNPVQSLTLDLDEEDNVYKSVDDLIFLQKIVDDVVGRGAKSTVVLSYDTEEKGKVPAELKIKLDVKFGF